MELSLQDKYELIKEDVLKETGKNPIEIAINVMKHDYVKIHGPEHHFIDGASFLVAYKNAGGAIDINASLDELAKRTVKMPGAMCGYFGVCGSVTSLGACLSIINKTGPLTDNDYYKDNMEYTSKVIGKMSKIGGPRCCKRNCYLSLSNAIIFVKEKYNVELEINKITCSFKELNKDCIKERCPFYKA